jgi:hypothetical protein
MSDTRLRDHFDQTPAPGIRVRERVRAELALAAISTSGRCGSFARLRRLPWRMTARLAMLVSAAVLVAVALGTEIRSHDSRTFPPLAVTYRLENDGTPIGLSEFDPDTQQLFRDEGVTQVWSLGGASGWDFYRFAKSDGRACYGVAADSPGREAIANLDCYSTGSGLPGPVVDMSTVALNPTVGNQTLRLTAVRGIAASDVALIVVSLADGSTIHVPVTGDAYARAGVAMPTTPADSIAAISSTGTVLWSESFSQSPRLSP